jgi:hypothetical protein
LQEELLVGQVLAMVQYRPLQSNCHRRRREERRHLDFYPHGVGKDHSPERRPPILWNAQALARLPETKLEKAARIVEDRQSDTDRSRPPRLSGHRICWDFQRESRRANRGSHVP